MMDYVVVGLALLVFGFLAYKMLKPSKPVKTSGKGQTIVVDRTPVDTSKEDRIADKFGELK